jgi:rhomboid protease GluP
MDFRGKEYIVILFIPMENLFKKIRLIFVPYLLLLLACMVVYSFLNWRLYLLNPSDRIPEGIVLILGPVLLAIVVVLIWLRPRLRLLTVKAERTYPQFALNMLSVMAMAIPVILLQHLLVKTTGELTQLKTPSDITKKSYSKYYTVAEFAELKKYAFILSATTTSNKGKTYVHHVYFAMPLIDKAVFQNVGDTIDAFNQLFNEDKMPLVWLCTEKQFRIKKKANTQAIEDEFLDESISNFMDKGFSGVTYMERMGNNTLRREYRKTIIKEGRRNELLILNAQFSPFENRYDQTLKWTVFGTLLSSGFLLLVFVIFTWDEERLQAFENKNRIW